MRFCHILSTSTSRESFVQFNNYALDDPKFGVNLALVFSSRSFDTSVENGSVIRAEMLNTLQKNYTSKCGLGYSTIHQMKKCFFSNKSPQYFFQMLMCCAANV